ncbi:G-protein coupled receptors family 1 profile domain-containing protein [Caenorhabditis elegans]|uniref:G-protein coupled receptors family 1 profile domain-containing protein n=1 Tax=Caenorhabditis elegans TaxID=6239 RepID=O44646_CAEEL|nr:G-protein coupled receptors family 1 profile domain-containing protein [Caenorhabditis elegans]CCD72736.2 G-protein coupled receptors family 1 profile domain-containing protein [Caenorhabditis elegans]|eukprot:NP_001317762.1 Serpentine Receptor, class X [Caenorhabditis elegans]
MDDIHQQTLYALLPISLIGSVLNWAIFYAVNKLECFNHSFGYLSASQAIVDAMHSTTFLIFFCPMVLLDEPTLKAMSHHCGFVLLLCYELSVMIHLAISLNRFCAVWAPYKYQNIFSDRNTKILIGFVGTVTGSIAIYFYEVSCHFYYDEKIHFLTFTNSEFCGYIGWYGDFLKNAVIVAIVVSIDILTVVKVKQMSKKISSSISDQAHSNLTSREIRFLKQTVTQGSVFMLELLTYFFVPRYFANRWIVFFATSFAWVAVHAVDGMVVILFNPEIRKFLLGKKVKNAITSTNQTSNNKAHA